MLSSAGFTCVAFVSGALALWAPEYMIKSLRIQTAAVDETTYVTQSYQLITTSISTQKVQIITVHFVESHISYFELKKGKGRTLV